MGLANWAHLSHIQSWVIVKLPNGLAMKENTHQILDHLHLPSVRGSAAPKKTLQMYVSGWLLRGIYRRQKFNDKSVGATRKTIDQSQMVICHLDIGGPVWSKSNVAKIQQVKSCHMSLMTQKLVIIFFI